MTDSASSMRHTERPKKSFSLRSRSRSNSTEKEPRKKFCKKVASKSECGFLFTSSLYTTVVNYLCHFRNTFAAFSFLKRILCLVKWCLFKERSLLFSIQVYVLGWFLRVVLLFFFTVFLLVIFLLSSFGGGITAVI